MKSIQLEKLRFMENKVVISSSNLMKKKEAEGEIWVVNINHSHVFTLFELLFFKKSR